MVARSISYDEAIEAKQALDENGNAYRAGLSLKVCPKTISRRVEFGKVNGWFDSDPEILDAAKAGGIQNVNSLSHFWKIAKDEDGNGYSLFVKNPNGGEKSLADMVRDAITESIGDKAPKFPKRQFKKENSYLLVVDLADVHFQKLCVKSETGYTYNREVARHRVIEGTKALLKLAEPFGIHRILFVLGNDILHTDNARSTTTKGTHQDTDGTIYQAFSDAKRAICDSIELCAEVADVDLIHCMSNHDKTIGWALSQAIGAYFDNHPHIHSTDYGLSEAHRKYYRFEENLFGLTHGDGAKEAKLYGLMVKEARQHISDTKNLYWLLHHVHHKVRKTSDGDQPYTREKDHNGMTAIMTGQTRQEGESLDIEYVRSPSAPDSWHDGEGYVNRQGVECFIYHPYDGQKSRFTEWF